MTWDRDAVIEQETQIVNAALTKRGAEGDAAYTDLTGEYPGPTDYSGISATAVSAALPGIVDSVTAEVRALRGEWVEFMQDPGLTDPERSGVRLCAGELKRLLDEIDAAAGVLR